MSSLSKPRPGDLEESLGARGSHLQHDGEDGEDDDLDGGSTSIPIWPTDPVLQTFLISLTSPPSLPLTLLATVEDWRRVADQVHWDTMVVAVRPMETFPPASKAVSRLSESW